MIRSSLHQNTVSMHLHQVIWKYEYSQIWNKQILHLFGVVFKDYVSKILGNVSILCNIVIPNKNVYAVWRGFVWLLFD